jgi:hypothetical protein
LEPREERDGGLLYPAASGEFALFESAGACPGTFTQMVWEVDDIESTVAELRARGVVFEEVDLPGLRFDSVRQLFASAHRNQWISVDVRGLESVLDGT